MSNMILLPRRLQFVLKIFAVLVISHAVVMGSNRNALAIESHQKVAPVPEQIELTHAGSWHLIALQSIDAMGRIGSQVSQGISWSTSDERVCRIEGDRVIAVGNGQAKVVAKVTHDDGSNSEVSIPVTVRFADTTIDWEFKNHVQSVMARAGCNMGACHGALAGKGGFRLSLRGYDSASDHFNITKQDRGRRVELAEPAKSLLLTKPSGAIAHKGGVRLPVDSHNYRVVSEWIAKGARPSTNTDPQLVSLKVLPEQTRLKVGDQQQLIVQASYDNGRQEDVTHWAKFSSADESVAQVDENGVIQVLGPGEGAVSVWFASRIVMARITVPYSYSVPESSFARLGSSNLIDQQVLAQLRQLNLEPSERCSDSEFIRRAFLDTVGTIPTAEEVEAFLKDESTNKRIVLIDSLLNRPEYVDYWAYRWSDMLMLNGNLLRPEPLRAYYQWIRSNVEKNTPWDQFVRDILTSKGDAIANGATNFYALNQDPESMTENACQAFLGLSIGCAKCHNHPLEKWTNDQYYAMANLFARVRAKGWGGDGREGDGKRTLVVLDRGDLIQPLTGKPQLPAPLDAPPLDPNSSEDRRVYLADWLASPENPYFTRAIVNRVWANYFGIGIVNSVDDLRTSNPASNEPLMKALEEYLIAEKYDLKRLMKLILESDTYQRSSMATDSNRDDKRFFSHYYPKRLMAEVIHDAVAKITGVASVFDEVEYSGSDRVKTDFYPEGTRAIQLYDSTVRSYFLKTFGRNQRRITCECERSDEPSVVQMLHLSNGSTLNDKLAKTGNVIDKMIETYGSDPKQLIERSYLLTLGRLPSGAESDSLLKEYQAAAESDRRTLVEDLYWGLMSSREFLFNH